MSYRREIASQLSEKFGGNPRYYQSILQHSLEILMDCIIKDGRVEIKNFGTFQIKELATRNFIHPVTRKPYRKTPTGVKFKPCKKMKRLLDGSNI